MSNLAEKTPTASRSVWVKSIVTCVLLLAATVWTGWFIFATEPEAVRESNVRKTPMLVEVVRGERGTFQPDFTFMGTVVPARDITLSPLVKGEVIECRSEFTPGGLVRQGDVLLKIDPQDYENERLQRQSDVRRAEADLSIERGRQTVARKDYELVEEKLSPENEALILRRPQLNTVQANLESARAALAQAELNLERTTVRAPFDAHVLSREVNLGSFVTPGQDLGRLVGTQTYWVEATVPLSLLPWLSFPVHAGGTGSVVRVRNRSAWPKGVFRTGHLFRRVGALEERTRMARVLIAIQDPLSKNPASSNAPPLTIGAYVVAHVRATALPEVVRLKREFIRKDNTVWVNQDGVLEIRKVDIVVHDATHAYIRGGLDEEDWVVATHLSTVVDGARLRLRGETDDAVPAPEATP